MDFDAPLLVFPVLVLSYLNNPINDVSRLGETFFPF